MKIIHYIPRTDATNASATEYVNCLVRSTANVAESYVITQKDLGTSAIMIRTRFLHKLKEIQPDIVHIHAAWDSNAAVVEHTARSHGFYTIVSVHGGLAPEVMELEFFKHKLPRIIGYEFQMVRKCSVIVAISEKDEQQIKQLKWKKRIVTIPHPSLHLTNDDETSELLMSIYRKVLDTNYMERITKEELEFVHYCVKIALWPAGTQETQEVKTDNLSFRRIYIYAYDNNITQLFTTGAQMLGVQIPPCPDVSSMPRFKVKQKRNTEIGNYQKLQEAIYSVIPGTKIEIARTPAGATIYRTMCDIFQALRFHDYDEDNFSEIIKKKGITKFTSRLLHQLQEAFGLELGYMPILPKK